MIIADTSIWIEYFRQPTHESNQDFAERIDIQAVVALSAVFGELLQGVRNEREEKIILDYWKFLPKVNEHNFFIEAGVLSQKYKLYNNGVGLIDCYILAAAKLNKFEIWSLDKKLLKAWQVLQV